MNFYLGVTNNEWYDFLRQRKPEDVNFWQPGGNLTFRRLSRGEPFLFKLKSPRNVVAGLAFFSSHSFLPISMAWEVFGERNGCQSSERFQKMILNNRIQKDNLNPTIGCIILTNPIFFDREDWLNIPFDWAPSIQQGKTYTTETEVGNEYWQRINFLIQKYLVAPSLEEKNQLILEETESPLYGKSILTKVRLGQGAFRMLVTDSYNRKCAISGEKTLPVLEAAHIKPFSQLGPHFISNALLLRSDLHKLFDTGYLTITSDLKVEISKRIKEEYENGREYYKFHGQAILNLPKSEIDKPDSKFIEWHNNNIFRE